jgi:hypothetical protein
MSLQVEFACDGSYFPTITFTYSGDGIRCSAEYSDGTNNEADDWRRFAKNLGLVIPDELEFGNDNGGSLLGFDGTEVTFYTSNHASGLGYTQFSVLRNQCLEVFQRLSDALDAWEANVDL